MLLNIHIWSFFLGASLSLSEGVMVCYFVSWTINYSGHYYFDVDTIDPFLCTHVIYSFAGIGTDHKIEVLDPPTDLCDNGGKCGYDRFTALKNINPDLVTTLAIGGANGGAARFSEMSADPTLREAFVDSVLVLLKAHNFDGLDMDWESPTLFGGTPEDKENFILLMNDLRDALHPEGLILTAAVSASKYTINQAFDVPGLSAAADLIHIMGYDLHGAWDPFTHHHTILYPYPEDTGGVLYLNLDYAVQYWLSLGAPAEKLVLGMAAYGHCWKLDSAQDTGMYAPASVPDGMSSTKSYNRLCEYNLSQSPTIVHEEVMNEPYAYDLNNDDIWCGYDDADSLAIKARYARDNGLAGAMIWTMNYDDFLAACNTRTFHLIKTIKENLAATP